MTFSLLIYQLQNRSTRPWFSVRIFARFILPFSRVHVASTLWAKKKTFLLNLTVLNKHLIGLDGPNHCILNGRSEQSGLRLRAMTIRFTLYWYAGNWKSCNVCRIFSVKAIFETRESRPKLISITREQNFQKCPALKLRHFSLQWYMTCLDT